MTEGADKAMQRALTLLSYRPRSRAELRRRLAERELPAGAIDGCLARLEELGLVDDTVLAGIVVRDAARFGRSRNRARARLHRLGIADAQATAALAQEYPEAREAEIATALVGRLLTPTQAASPEGRARAARLLRGRGFGARAQAAALAGLPAAAPSAHREPSRRVERPPPDLDALRRLVARRYPAHASDPAVRRRAEAFLVRRGVRGDALRDMLRPDQS